MEGRVPEEILNTLKLRGHPVKGVDDYTDTIGHAGAILVDTSHHILFGDRINCHL